MNFRIFTSKTENKILDSICHTEAQESEMSILLIDLFNKHLLSIYYMYMTKHWSVKMKLAWPLMSKEGPQRTLRISDEEAADPPQHPWWETGCLPRSTESTACAN